MSLIVVEVFNTFLLVIDRSTRQKVTKGAIELNNTE
jgi:hypothetical protein